MIKEDTHGADACCAFHTMVINVLIGESLFYKGPVFIDGPYPILNFNEMHNLYRVSTCTESIFMKLHLEEVKIFTTHEKLSPSLVMIDCIIFPFVRWLTCVLAMTVDG